jgi:hypothetical protein
MDEKQLRQLWNHSFPSIDFVNADQGQSFNQTLTAKVTLQDAAAGNQEAQKGSILDFTVGVQTSPTIVEELALGSFQSEP